MLFLENAAFFLLANKLFLLKIELFLLFVKDVLSTIKDFTQHRIPQTIFLGIFLKDVLSKINEKARLRQSNAMAHVTDNRNK